MGGKVWSFEEERCFWRFIIPQSKKRLGIHQANPGLEWKDLAPIMQAHMGDDSRRRYTGLMLFEHYFQNIEKQRVSPKASVFVHEYLRRLRDEPGSAIGQTPTILQSAANYNNEEESAAPEYKGPTAPVRTMDPTVGGQAQHVERKNSEPREFRISGNETPSNSTLGDLELNTHLLPTTSQRISPNPPLTAANLGHLNREHAIAYRPDLFQNFRHDNSACHPAQSPARFSDRALQKSERLTQIREEEDLEDGEIYERPAKN